MATLRSALVVACVALSPTLASAAAVTIDGAPVKDVVAQAGHLLVPFRAPMEQIGAVVDWSDDTQTGTASTNGRELVKVKVGDTTAYIDGNSKALDVAPTLVKGLEYIPVEMLPEISSASLALSADKMTATVTNFDLTGVDAVGAAAASADPGGKILYLWVWLLPIGFVISLAGFFAAKARLEKA
jgi:hypothetical protein